jgi:hypothetical protein
MTPTPQEIKARVSTAMNSNFFFELYMRWRDESEHESLDDYGVAFNKLDPGMKVVRCQTKPHFGFVVSFPEFPEGLYEVVYYMKGRRAVPAYRRLEA